MSTEKKFCHFPVYMVASGCHCVTDIHTEVYMPISEEYRSGI